MKTKGYIHLDIEPLSVNKAYKVGKKGGKGICIMYKSTEYKAYDKHISYLFPKLDIPIGRKKLSIIWGFKTKASDVDNPSKAFLDSLQSFYGFNDNTIYELILKKEITKKPFIKFKIESLENTLKL